MNEKRQCSACQHPLADHKHERQLDGRAGCVRAIGLSRCPCTNEPEAADQAAIRAADRKLRRELEQITDPRLRAECLKTMEER